MDGENKPKNTGGLKSPWAPGQSGNPGGRPKKRRELGERCRRIVDAQVVDAWQKEVQDRGPDWVACSKLLAAYGYGQPAQAVAVSHHQGMTLLELVREAMETDVAKSMGIRKPFTPAPALPSDTES